MAFYSVPSLFSLCVSVPLCSHLCICALWKCVIILFGHSGQVNGGEATGLVSLAIPFGIQIRCWDREM